MTFLCPRIVLPDAETRCKWSDEMRSWASELCSEQQLPSCGDSRPPAGLDCLADVLSRSPHTFASFLRSFGKSSSCHCLLGVQVAQGGDCGALPCSGEEPPPPPSEGEGACRRRPRLRHSSRGFELSSGGIRVLLFRECERRGRKLLYDSSTVLRVPAASLSFCDASAPLTTAPVRGLGPIALRDAPPAPSRLTTAASAASSLRSGGGKDLSTSLSLGAVLSSPDHKGVPIAGTRGASKSSDPLASAAAPRRPSEPRKNEIIMEITDDYVYQYCRQASDSKQLGELVFGCVQLAYRGPCTKLHTLAGGVVLSRTQPRPPAPSCRGPHAPHRAPPHPTLASDAGISSLGSSLDLLGRRASGVVDPSASDVSLCLGGARDRHLLPGDSRSNPRSEGAGFRRTSTVVSDLRSSLSVLSSPAGGGAPDWGAALRRTSTTPSEDDSGFGGPASWFSSHGGSFVGLLSLPVTPVGSVSSRGPLHNSSSGSLSNLQKRYMRRTTATALDCLAGPAPQPREGDAGAQASKSSSHKGQDTPQQAPVQGSTTAEKAGAVASHTRVGLAVVLSPHDDSGRGALEVWVSQQAAVLEGCMNRLQAELDVAYHNTSCFVSRAHAAVAAFQREVLDLLYGPRLVSPVWLQLLTPASPPSACPPPPAAAEDLELRRRRAVAEALVNSLSLLLRERDTKQTNFFMSRLLTAVLTYHLGWVTGAALQQDAAASQCPDGPVSAPAGEDGNHIQCRPAYFEQPQENESGVLTQLLELQGCLGCPAQCCRTVLLGSSASLLQHCLSILSYFIRCQQVEERGVSQERTWDLFGEVESEVRLQGVSWRSGRPYGSLGQPPATQQQPPHGLNKNEAQAKSTANGVSRNSSEATLQRSLSDASCTRSSGDSNGRRSSGDSNGRRSSIDSNGRRSSGDSNSPPATFPSTAAHRKRPSIHSCAVTALETLSELPSVEPPAPAAHAADTAALHTKPTCGDPTHLSDVMNVGRIFLEDFSGFREEVPPAVSSSSSKPVATTTTIGWHIRPSMDPHQGAQDPNFKTLSSVGQSGLENLGVYVCSSSNISAHSPVGFRKSKTSFNLSAAESCSPTLDVAEISQKVLDGKTCCRKVGEGANIAGSSRDTSSLYPDLTTLDGHREVFGPAELQPHVIADKVRKLCRVTPERSLEDPFKELNEFPASSSGYKAASKSSLTVEGPPPVEGSSAVERSSPVEGPPALEKSLPAEDLPHPVTAEGAVQPSAEGTKVSSKSFGGEIRFCGEMIRSEPEDGKKVIFIVGEDDVLDAQPHTAVSGGALQCSSSPHPPDFLEMREVRNVARAVCLDELKRESFTGVYRSGSERRLRQDLALGHKRTSSDPTARRPCATAARHPATSMAHAAPTCAETPTPACRAHTTSTATSTPARSDMTSACVTPQTAAVMVPAATCEAKMTSLHYSSTQDLETASVKDPAAVSEETKPCAAIAAVGVGSTSSLTRIEDEELPPDSDFSCVFLSEPSVSVCQRGSVLGVAEGVMGGVLDRYSPVFLLQAVINTEPAQLTSCTSFAASCVSSTTSLPHVATERHPRSGDPQTLAWGARDYPSTSSLEGGSRGAPHSPLSFASSLFGTSPTRLFSGLSVKTPQASAATERRPGSRSSGSLEAARGACDSTKSELLKSLQRNLEVDTRYSYLKANHVAILADMDDWSVCVVTSDHDGVPVGMSPLVASITDSLLQLVLLGAQPYTVLQCLEDKLAEVYRQSLILANYLLGGTTVPCDPRAECDGSTHASRAKVSINPGRLADLPTALGLDLNDLPLLLATASCHSPHLATMYGLAIR